MTCIVGIEYKNGVLIAGDLQGSGPNHKIIHTQPKVFKKGGVVFGYTTSYRFGQILEHNLPDPIVPENDAEVYRWLITVLVPDIQRTLKDNGWTDGGNCLIGVKDQLWGLQGDYSVLRSVKGYDAVGSGTEYALGSIFSSLSNTTVKGVKDAEHVLSCAIETAGTFCPTVGIECTTINTESN